MSGTSNAQLYQSLVQNVDGFGMVSGTPGSFSISLLHSVAAARAGQMAPEGLAVAPLTPAQAGLVQTAVAKSNTAATTTPSAASGQATAASTPTSTTIINAVLQGLQDIGSIPQDIQTLEAGTKGTLHWWGWSADLNEAATKAFLSLLTADEGIGTILTGLGAVSAPLAAVGAILGVVAKGYDSWITSVDTNQKGVTLNGWLWIAVTVAANP